MVKEIITLAAAAIVIGVITGLWIAWRRAKSAMERTQLRSTADRVSVWIHSELKRLRELDDNSLLEEFRGRFEKPE